MYYDGTLPKKRENRPNKPCPSGFITLLQQLIRAFRRIEIHFCGIFQPFAV